MCIPLQNASNNVKEVCVYTQRVNFYFRVFIELWRFLWGDHRLDVFAPSTLCVWNRMPWRNLQIRELPQGFLYELLLKFFYCQNLWCCGCFLQKPFWFFLRICSISGSMWLSSQALCNIMAEGFRFMPLSLVRLRTFWLSTWVS